MIPPVFILVRPQMGENIGAAARAMLSPIWGRTRMKTAGIMASTFAKASTPDRLALAPRQGEPHGLRPRTCPASPR